MLIHLSYAGPKYKKWCETIEGLEKNHWNNCFTSQWILVGKFLYVHFRTHMVNWMKCYLVSQFNPGNGINIKQTLKQSDFNTGNQVNPTGEDKINPARDIMITLKKLDAEDEKLLKVNIFKTCKTL